MPKDRGRMPITQRQTSLTPSILLSGLLRLTTNMKTSFTNAGYGCFLRRPSGNCAALHKCRFVGLSRKREEDHEPMHVHLVGGDVNSRIDLASLRVVAGVLPKDLNQGLARHSMAEEFTRWDATDYLKSEEDIALYLDASLDEDSGDGRLIRAAPNDIARAQR